MPKFDWNNNEKKDIFDQYIEMKVMSDKSYDDVDDFELETETDIDNLDCEDECSWREKYIDDYDLDLEDYETEEDYLEALELERLNTNVLELNFTTNPTEKKQINTNVINSKIYKYCKVMLEPLKKQYDYLCGDLDINVNDRVLVPFGNNNKQFVGTIVAVGKCLSSALPCDISNMKSVIKLLNDNEAVDNSLLTQKDYINDNLVYEDDFIKISIIKWRYNNYLVGGRARTGTFLFENKYDKRLCIYFKDISIGGYLNQNLSHPVAFSGIQKGLEDIIFVYDDKIPECYKLYDTIEFKVCYGRIEEKYDAISLINSLVVESDVISLKI